jgi:hypothetical protein
MYLGLSISLLLASISGIAADLAVHTFNPAGPDPTCNRNRSCATWQEFRSKHPWPYQALVVTEGSGESVVIVSEPPPSLTKPQLVAAIRALFGSQLVELGYYRRPTGLDGWLEDLVVHVRVQSAPRVDVISDETLTPVSAPRDLIDRLRILYRLQYQTTEGFSVGGLATPTTVNAGLDVKVTPEEISGWLTVNQKLWNPLRKPGAAETTRELMAEKLPGVFVREGGIVAFVAPRGVKLRDLEGPFRAFAVSTDLILGSTGSAAGGLILLGRERQAPIAVLPPLRFEDFASSARNKATDLAQSYERQRIFAGRIRNGPYKGWDWAPILLSSQLDDTSYGTLLNLADQILKSWSQHGEVEYYAFSYQKPATYPFGKQAASQYFSDQFESTSLLFNWNTDRVTTSTALYTGELLMPDRTGALSILYRPFGGLIGDEDSGPAEAKLTDSLYRDVRNQSEQAAGAARNYFATRGDPILVRVVQNTLLYQGIQRFLKVADGQDQPRPARSDRVMAVLQKEALAWLTRVTKTPADPDIDPKVRSAVRQFLASSELTVAQLSTLLASPMGMQQDIIRDDQAYGAILKKIYALEDEADSIAEQAHEEFTTGCGRVGGTITQTKDGRECDWKTHGADDAMSHPAFAAYRGLGAKLDANKAQRKTLAGQATTMAQAIRKKETSFAKAQELGKVLAADARDTDLDAVLESVLSGVSQQETAGSIRTPSVVLSKNTVDVYSVGGHNINLVPRVEATNRIGIVPAPSLSRPIKVSELVPPRPVAEALKTVPRKGSLLEAMRPAAQAAEERPEAMAGAAKRAAGCNCDALVTQEADGTILFVRNQPPPTQRPVFGKSGLIDALGGPPKPRVVRFENFPPESVEAIARSTALNGERPAATGMEKIIQDLGSMFKSETSDQGSLTLMVERNGRPPEALRLRGEVESAELLRRQVSWKTGRVENATAEAWTRAFGEETVPDPVTHAAIIVRFDGVANRESSTLGIKIGVAEEQRPTIGAKLSGLVRGWISARPVGSIPCSDGLLDLRAAIRKQLSPNDLDFFYARNAKKIRAAELFELRDPEKEGRLGW